MATLNDKTVLSSAELNAARVLIAFYFLAVAAGFTDGVTLAPVLETVLASETAHLVSQILLFAMGFLVLVGSFLRGVALIIAGFMLATYLLLAVRTGDWHLPSTIWRDVALVGALILTYAQREGFYKRTVPVGKRAKTVVPEQERLGGLTKAEQDALLSQVPGLEVRGLHVKSKTPRPKLLDDVFRDPKTQG